ncbi:MAG: SDR family oxidoreductase [Spirochaetia bacterium]|nr:SDR family oxidoreductase [Spirochaetia bacterium]
MNDNLFDVTDRIAIVTGGLGQIGLEFTLALLERGAKVAVFNRTIRQHIIDERIPEMYRSNEHFAAFEVDITKKTTIEAALEKIQERWGVPHILVNNAGVDTQPSAPPEVSGPFEQFPEDVFREVVNVNLTGTFLCSQVVGAAMAKAERGSIINIGSIYGMLSPVQDIYAYKERDTGIPFVKPVAYSASKSGIYNLTRYMATYWGRKGVRVNTLSPSGVFRDTQDAEFQRNYCARIPIGRMAAADEYNGAMLFLASDASTYMTGSNLVIDGGWSAW